MMHDVVWIDRLPYETSLENANRNMSNFQQQRPKEEQTLNLELGDVEGNENEISNVEDEEQGDGDDNSLLSQCSETERVKKQDPEGYEEVLGTATNEEVRFPVEMMHDVVWIDRLPYETSLENANRNMSNFQQQRPKEEQTLNLELGDVEGNEKEIQGEDEEEEREESGENESLKENVENNVLQSQCSEIELMEKTDPGHEGRQFVFPRQMMDDSVWFNRPSYENELENAYRIISTELYQS